MMLRLLGASAIAVLAAVPIAPASAGDACVGITSGGLVASAAGPFCVGTPFTTNCGTASVNAATVERITVLYCAP